VRPTHIFVIIAVLFISVVAFLAGRGNVQVVASPTATATLMPTRTPVPSPTPIIITSQGVLRRIESTEILQTTVFRIDTLVRAQKEGSWFFNWGGQKLLVFVKGSVMAGIDLKELKNVVVSEDERTIIITLPPAKILSATLDSHEIKNYDGETPSDVKPDLLDAALNAGRQQIAATACEDGIMQRATDDAKAAFEHILSFVDFADYKVSVLTIEAKGCPIQVAMRPAA